MMALSVGLGLGDSAISGGFSHRQVRASSGVGKWEESEQREPIRSCDDLTLVMLETGSRK
jgi:hypothetical protein